MLCKNCGEEVTGSKFCPNCGASLKPESKRQYERFDTYKSKNKPVKTRRTGIYVVLVVVGIFMIMFAVSGNDSNEPVNTSPDTTTETTAAKKETKTEADNKVYVGQTYETKDMIIYFDSVNMDEAGTIYSQPNQGNKYISATFTYENKKSSGNIYASIYDFDCYADNSNCEQKYIGDSSFINTNLSPGKKVTFTVYFEVPENAETIELEYKPMLQSKHIPFVIK